MAKGCGMIAPNMATMLAFLTTDADVPRDELQQILSDAPTHLQHAQRRRRDLDQRHRHPARQRPRAARPTRPSSPTPSTRLCEDLTLQMARDAEGMTKMVMLRVTGAASRRRSADRGQEHRREQSRQMLLVRLRPLLGPAARRGGLGRRRLRYGKLRGRLWRHRRLARAASRSPMTAPPSPRT